MSKYNFIMSTRDGTVENQSVDLPDIRAAHVFATRMSSDWLGCAPDQFWIDGEIRVTVTDEADTILCTLVTLGLGMPGKKGADII